MSVRRSTIERMLDGLVKYVGIRSVVFEVTQDCNQNCAFCYNVWKCGDYPSGCPDSRRIFDVLDKIISYRPGLITFSGGEPLLFPDLLGLIRRAPRGITRNLITNGTLMTDSLAGELVSAGVQTFEFTLLSADPETHNALVGRDSFDRLIEAIASVRAAGGRMATTFVATRANIDSWEETLELNVALGVEGVLFNRFNIGGAGVTRAAELMPSVDQLGTALGIANEGVSRFGVAISCGVPIPPCVLDRSLYPNVHFGDCAVGTRNAYPTVDALGNVRPCNHSPTILGNLFEADFRSLVASDTARDYAAGVPSECENCKDARACRGGCRAAAEVCGACGVDPFVKLCGCERN